MANIETGIFGLLDANASMQALLLDATSGHCKIFPVLIPEQISFPAVAYVRISGSRELTLNGSDGFITARFQFLSNSTIPDDNTSVIDALIAVLHGFAGPLPGGAVIQMSNLARDPMDDYDPAARLYMRHCDFEIIYNEKATLT